MAEPSNSERFIFRLSLALVSLHVVDDNFLQPQPGTSAGDHVVSGLVPLALLVVAAAASCTSLLGDFTVAGSGGGCPGPEDGRRWPERRQRLGRVPK